MPWPVVGDDVLACVYVSDEEDRDEERERTLGFVGLSFAEMWPGLCVPARPPRLKASSAFFVIDVMTGFIRKRPKGLKYG